MCPYQESFKNVHKCHINSPKQSKCLSVLEMKSGSQDGYEDSSVVVERTRSKCRDVNCLYCC